MLLIYLPHFPSESSRFFFDGREWANYSPMRALQFWPASVTVLSSGSWPVLSQSYCAGDRALYLGVAEFSDAATAEKNKRDPLPQLASPGAGLGRSIRSRRRAHSRLDRGASLVIVTRCLDRSQLPHSRMKSATATSEQTANSKR